MRENSPKYLLVLLLIFTSLSVFSQQGGVRGTVQTAEHVAIPHANILVKGTTHGAVTDDKGDFLMSNLNEGLHTLVVSSIGYGTLEKSVSITSGQITSVQFELMETTYQLAEVTVTNQRSMNEEVVGIGKSGIKPLDLPQSVMTLTKDVLDQQQTVRLSDVLKNVNGLYVMGSTGGYQEELAGRGFAYNSSNTFKNGSRFNNGIFPEMSSLERVEVMKGSNAILFGNVAAGGVINLVTKKPRFEKGGEISMKTGSYGFYKPSFDIYGALDDKNKVAYRVNTAFESANSFRDQVSAKRFYVNPSLVFKAGKKTELLLEADYLDDHRTLDYGIGAINYQISPLPRNRFLGASWSYYNTLQKGVTLTANHQLSDNWKLHAVGSIQDFQNDLFGTTRPNANSQFIGTDGKWIRGLQRSQVKENYYLGQVDLTGRFTTGTISHTVLLGADVDGYTTNTTAYANLAKYDSINIFDLELYKQRNDIPELSKRTQTNNVTNRVGVYAQDLLTVVDQLKILAGVRYSYLDRENRVYTYPTKTAPESDLVTNYYDGAFTPRFGLVYQPLSTTSLFASYANSFTLNSGIDVDSKPLPPTFIDQYEVGVKNELFKGLLSANVTAYQIVNKNFAQTVIIPKGNPNNIPVNAQELAGEVTSKGIEVDLMTKTYKGVSVIAGYSFNETRYTKSNIYQVGSKLRYNPQHTANTSVYYSFNEQSLFRNFNLGTSFFYTGNRVAGRSTRLTVTNDTYKLMPIPDFLLIDASIGYASKKYSIRMRISNLLNTLSYNVHDDNSVNPIAPRMISTSLTLKI